jgi:carboxypeptidase Taq
VSSKSPLYEELLRILNEAADLNNAAAVLSWDQEVNLPPAGVESRAEQLATLSRLSHARLTSARVGDLLQSLEAEARDWDYDSDEASIVRVTRRDYDDYVKLPPSLVEEIARADAQARPVWLRARAESNWSLFADTMRRTVDLSARVAEALGYEKEPYDALIRRSEPGLDTAAMQGIFDDLRAAIVPLVREISERSDAVDDSILHRSFSGHDQLVFALAVVRELGYDLDRGRQDLSAHPFSTSFGWGDARITTRVSEDFLSPCLFGSIHESGHAMYTQGHSRSLDRTPAFEGASPGLHESQSRLWENLIGRSRPFWVHYLPKVQAAFPGVLDDADAESMYRAVNKVQPTYIRVEADEVTYNLHILLRFEIERDLLNGVLSVDDLPEAWGAKVGEYLGLAAPSDSDGPLQDIHWTFPSLGGFVGYTLGNVIGAQLMETIRGAIPDLDERVARGEFSELLLWLRENVYRHGRKFTPSELVERVTGKPIGAEAWIAYARRKFGEIYGLDGSPG